MDRIEADKPNAELQTWVEPELSVLSVDETAAVNGPGGDGGAYPDSLRS